MSAGDSSGSASSDSEDEQMEFESSETQLKELEAKLAENPNDYETHVKLIEMLRKLGELLKLRAARRAMSGAFPLSPKLWLEWLQDEIQFASDPQEIQELFDKAVDDYVSFDVWLEYVQWAIGAFEPSAVRDVFERALTAVGLQVNKGKLLWDAYRELEMALMTAIPNADTVQIESQQNRILSLFKRQLAVPLMGMEETYTEMQEYLESIGKSEVDETVESLYKKAKSQLIKLQEFEDSLDRNGGNMPDYQKYIDYERKTGNPARVISIYERSAVENCLNFQLWIDYGHYLDREVKIGDLAVKVYSRAVRNCPWVTQLWTQYLMVMEKYPRENHWKAISSAFEQSLNGGFSSAAEGIELWLSYAYAIRRKISAETDKNSAVVNGTSNYSEMKEVLGRGAKSLKELFLDEWDSTGHYRKSWAYLEGYYGGNLEKMRELWQEILHEGNARFASVWLEYFNAERLFGDVESRRKVLLKAVHSASDYPESICHQLIQFEREEGSVETLESAVLRVEQQLGRVNERRAKQNERESQEKQQKKKPAPLRQQHPVEPKKKTQMIFETSDEAKPQNRREIGTKRPAEEIKPQPKPSSKPTEVDTEGFAIPSGPPVSKKPKVADTQNIPNPKSTKPAVSTGAQQHDTSRYPRTVFISNLDFHLSDPESRLRDIFTPIGSISEIRLVKHISGRFKGYAYVEFSNEEVVPEALKLDHHRIDGRPMYVSRCQERNDRGKNSSEPPPGFKFGLGLEKKKLFVRNIPIEITEEQLREIFQPYGSLKEVRLATFKNGKSKGWAFVEFDDESSASKALVKTDGTVVGGKEISVAISNPPARKERLATAPMIAPTPEQLAMKFTPALGGQGSKSGTFGAGETSMEGRKERLDVFKPRIITSKTVVKEESSKSSPVKTELAKLENNTEPTAMAQSSKMSNEQFRNLFMKK